MKKYEIFERFLAEMKDALISIFEGFAYDNMYKIIDHKDLLRDVCRNDDEYNIRLVDAECNFISFMLDRYNEIISLYKREIEKYEDINPDDYNDFLNQLTESYYVMHATAHDIIYKED